ncbi:hypothetical protein MRX96_039952 [Rhipicephalus microplus]
MPPKKRWPRRHTDSTSPQPGREARAVIPPPDGAPRELAAPPGRRLRRHSKEKKWRDRGAAAVTAQVEAIDYIELRRRCQRLESLISVSESSSFMVGSPTKSGNDLAKPLSACPVPKKSNLCAQSLMNVVFHFVPEPTHRPSKGIGEIVFSASSGGCPVTPHPGIHPRRRKSKKRATQRSPRGRGRCPERRRAETVAGGFRWLAEGAVRPAAPPRHSAKGAETGGTKQRGCLPVWLLLLLLTLHLAALVATQSSIAAAGVSSPAVSALFRRRQQAQPIFHIGAVVNPPDSTSYFAQAIEDAVSEHGITLYAQTVHMNSNPIRIAQSVCENLISSQVFAVVISHPVSGELSPAAVSYTCGFYNNLHRTFLRTVPPYSQQADVWVELLQFLKYRCVVFIHSSDNDGRATLGRFQNKAEPQGIKLERVIEYEPGITDITQELEETKELHCRVFVLYATAEDATGIYSEVAFLNMTSPGYVWIVSEQALRAPNVPDGVLGLELVNASDEKAHIRDSVQVIALALKELQKDPNMTQPNISCSMLGNSWESGLKLVSLLKKQKLLRGETGRVRFDDKGDRLDSDYDILNVVRGSHVPVGQYVFSKTETPLGYVIPKHLRVATIAERPFVWVRPVADESQCLPSEILCPWTNSTDGVAYPYCCEGYCMDLLRSLAQKLNFTYTLYQVQDGQYGTFDFVNGSTYKRWSGMVGDLVRGVADMIIAPLTITPERSMEIDFTKPFKYQGITILAKKQDKSSTLASFLQPFQKTLWILVMVSVHVVALALYLLDRFSPFGRYKLPNSDATEEDALNLSSAIWFAWGVLLNSGIAEGTPRSFSGRVLGMVWAGFAMIVVASYTANLAAFLVLEKPESSLSGINDPRLRNPSENFTYATVKGSAVDMYFRRQVELSNMYRIMEGKNYETVEEGIEALKNK